MRGFQENFRVGFRVFRLGWPEEAGDIKGPKA